MQTLLSVSESPHAFPPESVGASTLESHTPAAEMESTRTSFSSSSGALSVLMPWRPLPPLSSATASSLASQSTHAALDPLFGGPLQSDVSLTVSPLDTQLGTAWPTSSEPSPVDISQIGFDFSQFMPTSHDLLFDIPSTTPILFERDTSFQLLSDTLPMATTVGPTPTSFEPEPTAHGYSAVSSESESGSFVLTPTSYEPEPTISVTEVVTAAKQDKLARLRENRKKQRQLDEENARLMAELGAHP
jgi:hypothetical protein